MTLIEKQPKYLPYYQENFINVNILLVKIYYHPPSNKKQNNLNLLILVYEKLFKSKQIRLRIKGKKQVDAVKTLKSDNNKKLQIKNENIIPKNAFVSDEAKEEINNILKIEKNVDREKLVYDASKYRYDFRKFNTIRTFGEDIYDGKITLEVADEDQSDLANEINKFIKEAKPKMFDKKQEKKIVTKKRA